MTQEAKTIEYPPVKYDAEEAEIARFRGYLNLKIQGIKDKGGLASVHDARMEIKRWRCSIENRRLDFGRQILGIKKQSDDEAKRLIAEAAPIEAHLAAEEKKIADEKARLAEEKRQAVQARVDALLEYGAPMRWDDVAAMPDEEYADVLEAARNAHEAEQRAKEAEERKRREAEEAERRRHEEEEKRLAEERAKQEAERKALEEKARKIREDEERIEREQAAARAKIEAERRALEDEKRAERERKEAEERAAQEAQERAEREKREAEERKAREEAEKARREAMRPDFEKLNAYGEALLAVPKPTVETKEAIALLKSARERLKDATGYLLIFQPEPRHG